MRRIPLIYYTNPVTAQQHFDNHRIVTGAIATTKDTATAHIWVLLQSGLVRENLHRLQGQTPVIAQA